MFLLQAVVFNDCPPSGPSLLELLDAMPMVDRKVNSPLMMPISEKYKDMGTIIVGKIESGHLKKGENLILMPNKSPVEVAAIYSEMEEELDIALSGDNVRIRLRGVEDDDISPGFVLTSSNKPIHAVRQFEAQLAILEHKNIICAGYSAVMHIHTLAEEVTLPVSCLYLRNLVADIDLRPSCITLTKPLAGNRKNRPSSQRKVGFFLCNSVHATNAPHPVGQKIVALVETAQPVCVERFAHYPQLGRFTLRDEGRTIAIGKVWFSS